MSSSNWCFLACIQISQETVQMVWYSYIFKNIPQFVVIHTVKGFGIVSKAEIDVFWNFLAFLMIQRMLAIWSLVPLPLLNPAWTSGSSWFMYCWSLAWRILSITLLTCGKGKLLSRVWLCNPMDCSLPGFSVHRIFQARVLEWVAISFFRGSSRPRSPALQADSLPTELWGKPRTLLLLAMLLRFSFWFFALVSGQACLWFVYLVFWAVPLSIAGPWREGTRPLGQAELHSWQSVNTRS